MTIICTGKIANTSVGHVDHAMAYASGFQKLGHEVYLMEHVGTRRCADSDGHKVPFEKWSGRRHFESVAKSYGLWSRSCLIYKEGQEAFGMSFHAAVNVAKRCDLLISRSGEMYKTPEIFNNARCRAYFDGNPGNTQVLSQKNGGGYEALEQYHSLFTLGLNIGEADCEVPVGKQDWHHQVRPVVLPLWPVRRRPRSKRFTTISSWKGRATFHLGGTFSGEKSDNWFKFIELPKKTGLAFEIALKLKPLEDQADKEMFQKNGWRLSNPERLSCFKSYKDFIGESRAEFSVAHNRYVRFSTGWFSDRSALYLASGKPVLVQSTGIEKHLPTGRGLLTFRTMEEAIEGAEEIDQNYALHCRAAREIAEEYFDSDKVLNKILGQIAWG